jgi:hypothetical protein
MPECGGVDPQVKSSEDWKQVGNNKTTNFMIVSEDVSTCLYVEILAHQDGIHARYFTEPMVALHAFEKDPDHWSLVFVDTLSPLVTKLSLASKIKDIKPDIRLVLLASHAPEQIRESFRSKPVCGLCNDCNDARNRRCFFLHKPFYRDFDRAIETAMKAA